MSAGRRLFLLVLFPLFFPLFPAVTAAECLDDLERVVAKRNALLEVHYERISSEGLRPDNEWKLYRGTRTDQAVLLVHGFIASPWEVEFLARELQADGHTVLLPLIEGFGGSTWTANHTPRSAWKQTFEESLADLSRCYPKVAIGGFSLGGGLVLDYVLRTENLDPISSVFLLAPYVKPKIRGARFFSACAGFFCRSLPLKGVKAISGNDDLRVPIAHPQYYNSDLPLKAVHEIAVFSKELLKTHPRRVLQLPVFLAYSEADQTVDVHRSVRFVTHHFSLTTVFTLPDFENVPHQIAVPDGRGHSALLAEQLLRFLR